MAKRASDSGSVKIKGLACHIGSQIFDEKLILETLDFLIKICTRLNNKEQNLKYIDLGGGLGISYDQEEEIEINKLLDKCIALLKPLNLNLILEPGRSISGNAGVLISKIEYLKKTSELNFAIIDAGMNDLLRPSLYQAWHNISVVENNNEEKQNYKIVGPVCESGDVLGEHRSLALSEDSIVAILDVGAYGHVMSSNYNSRLRPPEVLIKGSETKLIRKRETFNDMLSEERDV